MRAAVPEWFLEDGIAKHECVTKKGFNSLKGKRKTLNQDGLLSLEQPLVRVPLEQFRRAFKTSQKYIEKDLAALATTTADLALKSGTGALLPDEVCRSLDAVADRLLKLKRKLEESKNEEFLYTQRSKTRLDHLNELSAMPGADTEEYSRWSKTRLDRILVDFMLREGYTRTAETLANESGLKELVDIELFLQSRRVVEALMNRICTPCLQWCAENKSSLRKMKSTLEFNLRLQEKHLTPWSETHLQEIQHAMGLIAFTPDTTCDVFRALFDIDRWQELIEQFQADHYTLNSLTSQPLLYMTLQAGLAALKTASCYQQPNRNINCPVCAADTFGVLAERLPCSHHVNSCIVCRISGLIMNEDNPPMVLPNGYVYSYQALTEMAEKNNGNVTCPRSGSTYNISQLRRAYIA
ncbi:hypothetical protein SeMB42_g05036 [Synchytrium endobioticum]|uniref:Macrophage erythroblast attacher n=1 Tax=Synchytrium endobioticum TaxID=286115 RepID=A0A507CRM6_9FUNG|nr:hypothetical protein SeLEV6574_g05967 [Synchytrium endobioticum]TPX42664.1 hypothetical protein SeMB42_g05036 [Synchytrium endobioticum]